MIFLENDGSKLTQKHILFLQAIVVFLKVYASIIASLCMLLVVILQHMSFQTILHIKDIRKTQKSIL